MFDFLIPRSNFGSNTAPVLEGGEGGTATKMQKNERNIIEVEDFAENLTIGNAVRYRV